MRRQRSMRGRPTSTCASRTVVRAVTIGMILATLHRLPRTGEEFRVGRYHLTVLEADERRVVAVKIRKEAS